MIDAETQEAIFDGYQTSTLTEVFAIVHLQARLRNGEDPAQVLADMEADRESLLDGSRSSRSTA